MIWHVLVFVHVYIQYQQAMARAGVCTWVYTIPTSHGTCWCLYMGIYNTNKPWHVLVFVHG